MSDPLEECLKSVCGLHSFRQGQREIVSAVHNGVNVFITMPTGGGKTLCFSLPVILRKGVTIVIVPLVALGVDLLRRPFHSLQAFTKFFMTSTATRHKQKYSLPHQKVCSAGKERIGLKERNLLEMVVVDEAHCMDEMGHEFRPTYLGLSKVTELNTQIVAVTATATPTTKDFITEHLNMGDCTVSSPDDNRQLNVDKWKSVVSLICNKHEGSQGQFPRCEHGPLRTGPQLGVEGIVEGIMDGIVDFDLGIDLLAAETCNFADLFLEHVGIDLEQFSTQPDPFVSIV
ncbi:hypothetical protein Bbelb_334200 [Branchiostoma belcheri]|nr:hypothetical protein Bbelb_334200 [Branchiostoma belcheri]